MDNTQNLIWMDFVILKTGIYISQLDNCLLKILLFNVIKMCSKDGLSNKLMSKQHQQSCFSMKMLGVLILQNDTDIGWRLDYLEKYYKAVGCNLLIIAYSGYDESTGSPS